MNVRKYMALQAEQEKQQQQLNQSSQKLTLTSTLPTLSSTNAQQMQLSATSGSSPLRFNNLKKLGQHLESEKQAFLQLAKQEMAKQTHYTSLTRGRSQEHLRSSESERYERESSPLCQTGLRTLKRINVKKVPLTRSGDTSEYNQTQSEPFVVDSIMRSLSPSQAEEEKPRLFANKGAMPLNLLEILPYHVREFFSNKVDFSRVFNEFDVANRCLFDVNEKVRCYRYELGCAVEKIQESFAKITEHFLTQTIRLYNDSSKKFDRQLKENLANIEKLEREKREIESVNRDIKNRYVVLESLFKITKLNSDSLQSEIILLHDLLKRDILQKINHVANLESNQNKIFNSKDDQSERMTNGLQNLNQLIGGLESEYGVKDSMMNQMSGLVKAMLKGSKSDAFTQVDEGELIWLPHEILGKGKKPALPSVFDSETSSINIINLYNNPLFASKEEMGNRSNQEQLRLKEKDLNQSSMKKATSTSSQDNWNLTINLIVFIENVTKLNENGRVIPWMHFKNMIFEIYEERLKCNWEISGAVLSTSIPFDEYICLFFLKNQRLRRVAESKLFEFLISLRYYMKNHTRAMTFALLCNFANLNPSSSEAFSFKFDVFIQNYFLFCFNKLIHYKSSFIEQDGFTYINKDLVNDLLKDMISFVNEQSRQRIFNRLIRASVRLSDEQEAIEVDRILDASIEEYIDSKKKIIRNLTKNYAKVLENEHGVFSIDDLASVIKDSVDSESTLLAYRYPGIMTYTRVFLHALTSTRNNFDVAPKEFLLACSKYGIDSPFPLIRVSSFDKDDFSEEEMLRRHKGKNIGDDGKTGGINGAAAGSQEFSRERNNQSMYKSRSNKSIMDSNGQNFDAKVLADIPNEVVQSKNSVKIESTSALFAQHFSILREMRQYCKNFKDSYAKEEDREVLWVQFGNILNILEAGCQFLNFPINV